MSILNIDREQTRKKANDLLSKYKTLKSIASSYETNVTAFYSHVPNSFTGRHGDKVATTVERKAKAEKQVTDIEMAIKSIDNVTIKRYLIDKYILPVRPKGFKERQALSKKALDYFSEVYNSGELLVFFD